MSESDAFKNLDDFVLLHYASRYNWKNILETGELRSSYYSGKLRGEEYELNREWGLENGGNPIYVYVLLWKKSKLDKLPFIYRWEYPVFYFDPRMILNYRDKVSFWPEANFGLNGIPYKRFPKTSLKGFEDLWPKNDEEELALNLHNFWSMVEKKKCFGDNELLFEVDFISINDYILKVESNPIEHNPDAKKWNNIFLSYLLEN